MSRRVRPTVALLFLLLLLGSASRAWLALSRADELADLRLSDWIEMFVRGLRLDLVVASALCALPALALATWPARRLRVAEQFVGAWAAFALTLLAAAEVAGLEFFGYYDFRPNYLVLDHGADPEVASAILAAHSPLVAGAATLGLAIVSFFCWRRLGGLRNAPERAPEHGRIASLVALPLLFLGMRGTIDHRPLNPTFAAFGSHRLANEIAGNGILNVAHEAVQRSKGRYVAVADVVRPLLPAPAALERVREHLAPTGTFTDDSANPLVRHVGVDGDAQGPRNVMLVVLESYTARLVGHLGGELALTPELDRLATESVILENCFATGERTIQGLEAVLSSFPPLPGVGVVRRPEARGGFETLATTLAQRGYATRFLYGGQGIFDSMSGFFLANGFQEFIEQEDFTAGEITFEGAWGVCDEDVYRRADREMRVLHAAGSPFLVTVLSVSLHDPWEYPKGVIEPVPDDIDVPKGFEREELNTFLYADAAIGRFMALAKTAPYYDDTLFVFVGDHGVHLRGKALVPADEYRVAALFHSPAHLPPGRIGGVTSQLDVAPSILGVLGGRFRSTFFGRDLGLRSGNPPGADRPEGVAVLVYDKKRFALVRGSRMTILAGERRHAMRTVSPALPWEASEWGDANGADAEILLGVLQTAETLLEERQYTTRARASS